jgi:uncharacterized cupin superfamily protein
VFRSVLRPRCECDYDEMCHILDGTMRLTDADGVVKTFGPGDSFVAAAGSREPGKTSRRCARCISFSDEFGPGG